MGGTGYWILVDAGCGREETRHEVESAGLGLWGHDHASDAEFPEPAQVGRQTSQSHFRADFDEDVEAVSPDIGRLRPESVGQGKSISIQPSRRFADNGPERV